MSKWKEEMRELKIILLKMWCVLNYFINFFGGLVIYCIFVQGN